MDKIRITLTADVPAGLDGDRLELFREHIEAVAEEEFKPLDNIMVRAEDDYCISRNDKGNNRFDLKLKDLRYAILMSGTVMLDWVDTGEQFSPSVGWIEHYYDCYVTGITAHNDALIITIKREI